MSQPYKTIRIRGDIYEQLRALSPYEHASFSDTLYSLLDTKKRGGRRQR